MTFRLLVFFVLLAQVEIVSAWDGYDSENDTFVEIEKGNLVRSGRDIEIFDYDKGEYRDVEVQSIQRRGRTVELEVIDNESGEQRTFEMEESD